MVALSDLPQKLTPEAYLAWEEKQLERYEYIDGNIYAMTGGSIGHNRIALNLYRALFPHLESRGCDTFVSDVKVQDLKSKRYFYPDLVITCDADDLSSNKFVSHPTVIVEVLSPSTSSYDKDLKLKYYRQIESLREYVLIHSEQQYVELFQKQTEKIWGYSAYSEGIFELASVEFSCAFSMLYNKVIFDD